MSILNESAIRETLQASPPEGGVQPISIDALPMLTRTCEEQGFNCWHIDCSGIQDAAKLLATTGESLKFPVWYGHNWDALADCLSDLGWCEADGHVLVLSGHEALVEQVPRSFETYLDVLGEASEIWREAGTGFWVFIASPA